MKTPIIMLCGNAGAGKNAVADILAARTGFRVIGQADAIKELIRVPFGLTQDQLYGPSESRNAVVEHLNTPESVANLKAAGLIFSGNSEDDELDSDFSDIVSKINKMTSNFNRRLFRLASKFFYNCADQAAAGTLTTRYILQQLGTEVGRAYDQLIWTRATFEDAQNAISDGAPGVVISDGRFRSEILTAAKYGAQTWLIRGTTTLAGSTHASEVELDTLPEHFFDAIIDNDKEHGLESLATTVGHIFDYTFGPAVFSTQVRLDAEAGIL